MAITIDLADSATAATGSSSVAYTHGVVTSEANRAAIIGASGYDVDIIEISGTHGAVALVQRQFTTNINQEMSQIATALAPASGNSTVTVNVSPASDTGIVSGSASYYGVHQTTFPRTSAKADAASTVNLTSLTAGDYGQDHVTSFNDATITIGADQTQWYSGTVASNNHGRGSYEAATGTSITMSWTGASFPSMCAVALAPADVGAAAVRRRTLAVLGAG